MIDCVRILLSKHGWLFLLLLGLSGWPSPAFAMTGNEWRALPMAARTSYVTGVVDNLVDFGAAVRSLVPAEKRTASEKMLVSFEECIVRTPRPPGQLVAIVDKYMGQSRAVERAHVRARVRGAQLQTGRSGSRGPQRRVTPLSRFPLDRGLGRELQSRFPRP